MTKKEIDQLWNKAIRESVEDGTMYTRYHFAALVAAAEREACAKVCESMRGECWAYDHDRIAAAIRARKGNT